MLGYSFPGLSSHKIWVTLWGIDRMAQHCPLQALPVTPQLLVHLVSGGDNNILTPFTLHCHVPSFSPFFLFSCISNLVPNSICADHTYQCLHRGDVCPTHYGLCVKFTWSKTNQFRQRVLVFFISKALPNKLIKYFVSYTLYKTNKCYTNRTKIPLNSLVRYLTLACKLQTACVTYMTKAAHHCLD